MLKFKINKVIRYEQVYPWLSTRDIINIFKIKPFFKHRNVNGIVIKNNDDNYLLTTFLDTQYGYDFKYKDIECENISSSFEFNLRLFKINGQIEEGINIDNIQIIKPNENIKINNKIFNLDIIQKEIPFHKRINNIYYHVTELVPIGLPAYYNDNLIGMSISKTLILNIKSIINFVKQNFEYKEYLGFPMLYYEYKMDIQREELKDTTYFNNQITIVTNNYDISYNKLSTKKLGNLKNGDLLLEIDNNMINNNYIDHIIYGRISVQTFVMLNYNINESIPIKIYRKDKIKNIRINCRSIFSLNPLSTNINEKTKYKIIDKETYIELNCLIFYYLLELNKKLFDPMFDSIIEQYNIENNVDEKYVVRISDKVNILKKNIMNTQKIKNISDI